MQKFHLVPHALSDSSKTNRTLLPNSMGKGRIEWGSLKSGIQLFTMDYTPRRPMVLEYTPPFMPIGFGFRLSGRSRVKPADQQESIEIEPGLAVFNRHPDIIAGFTEIVGTQRVLRVIVSMDFERFFSFAEEKMSGLPRQLETLSTEVSRHEGPITPVMQATVFQILNCPYQGVARSFFLESKVLELVAHKLDQLSSCKTSLVDRPTALKPGGVERVRHAAEVLTRDLENPPDMTALARSVGLSRSSLYRLFGQVHGLSPFDYLRNHRLHTSMRLLQEGEANVTEAALMVGYSNLSHFAKAFKAVFGGPPSAFRKQSISSPTHMGRSRPSKRRYR